MRSLLPLVYTTTKVVVVVVVAARMGEKRNAYRLLVGRPEGRKPIGRLRRRFDG
jgi:hypothetical protein